MYRFALDYLKEWKNRLSRKPLVVRGARQVGKTYLIRELAKEFDTYIEINLETEQTIIPYFEKDDPMQTLRLLELHYNKKIFTENTLLFLDEIQAAPHIFAKLRYFYEKVPQLHIVAAGSLLEFIIEEHSFSMPVGRIEYMHLGPMTFQEFLLADENENVAEFLSQYSVKDDFPTPLHTKLLGLFKIYLTIGGMPESINSYVLQKSYRDCDRIKENILTTYIDDFGKYGRRVNYQRTLLVFKAIPGTVGKKFKYVNISREQRSKDLSTSLHMLSLARVCYKVHHSSCQGIPLGATLDMKNFKLLFLDVGLLLSACGLSMLHIEKADNLLLINAGSICEQFIGQHLLHRQDYYREPELHYWIREKSSSSAEIDYVVASGEHIVPIEVKAGKAGSLKSLHMFVSSRKLPLAVRTNTNIPSLVRSNGKMPAGKAYDYHLLSIPCYMIEHLDRLVNEAYSYL
ncbi:MAG: ATP-binding protein [bacterium]